MLGKAHNLLIRHGIYRALPHREGGGVARDIATGYYDREAVRAQLRRELKRIRNVAMFAHLPAHVIRVHSRTARGAASIPACIIARASARPPVGSTAAPTATRTVASLLYPRPAKATRTPKPLRTPSKRTPSTVVPVPSPSQRSRRTHRSTSRLSRAPRPASSLSSVSSSMSSRLLDKIKRERPEEANPAIPHRGCIRVRARWRASH